ncbi:glucans biosynthesis glucosyltransferase MdoH [Roseibacterium sp. SDUM158017]|uniref:glucans biosynthesis glucosyltransferase MdoH n=1 Tax=Roseicyclus salinarum TaxID=3036773 RepID=UPI0024157F42|nr:glucans biosynthesis glucosyltransferase MdoH [Roseibacterium sp. SDUM158017]MDG4647783.1 glucans biosynthesis glucosyltransferase MdoH [Roseibacterium sp. SDUM158017]
MSLVESVVRSARPSQRLLAARPGARAAFFCLCTALAACTVAAFALSVEAWDGLAFLALALVAISGLWIAGGAATAIVGLATPAGRVAEVPAAWMPEGQTAILVMLCGEDAAPLARHLAELDRGLRRVGLCASTRIFVLSDTSGAASIAAEESALRDLVASGRVTYRRRRENTGKKPGNVADWLAQHGEAFAYMMVLDADSRLSPGRVRSMIHRIETRPRLGLLQSGIALVPGDSRFGRHQRVSARLLSPNFGRGFAAWTGDSGNYWGHNAVMRVAAFRAAADLPRLSGPAPFGGPLLSHDFIEAAWIRRAGWAVQLDPAMAGSAEGAPQTVEDFHRRDRRWCQGNLQHLRLLAEPGLDPISRFHLVAGVISYLAAPIWLALLGLVASGAVSVSGVLPFATVALVLALPKLCALAVLWRRARTRGRRGVTLRAWLGELGVSAIIAPLVMVRQTASVLSVCMGRDCGWKSGRPSRLSLPRGAGEMAAGLGLAALALTAGGGAPLWLAPVLLPLVAAPAIVRALDHGAA